MTDRTGYTLEDHERMADGLVETIHPWPTAATIGHAPDHGYGPRPMAVTGDRVHASCNSCGFMTDIMVPTVDGLRHTSSDVVSWMTRTVHELTGHPCPSCHWTPDDYRWPDRCRWPDRWTWTMSYDDGFTTWSISAAAVHDTTRRTS